MRFCFISFDQFFETNVKIKIIMSIDNFAKINESDSTKSSTIFFFLYILYSLSIKILVSTNNVFRMKIINFNSYVKIEE